MKKKRIETEFGNEIKIVVVVVLIMVIFKMMVMMMITAIMTVVDEGMLNVDSSRTEKAQTMKEVFFQ